MAGAGVGVAVAVGVGRDPPPTPSDDSGEDGGDERLGVSLQAAVETNSRTPSAHAQAEFKWCLPTPLMPPSKDDRRFT